MNQKEFAIVAALMRAGIGNTKGRENKAVKHHMGRLVAALKESGNLDQAESIDKILNPTDEELNMPIQIPIMNN